jgi:hypothetical protein
MIYEHHNAKDGYLDTCQITGSSNYFEAIDLGCQPPCDALLEATDLNEPEISYPLRLNIFPDSGSAQIDYIVSGKKIYPNTYPYRSGISIPLRTYQQNFAQSILTEFKFDDNSLVVDIGSNDGTLLSGFKKLNMKTIGVEPTDIAKIAINDNKIDTIQSFFDENVSKSIMNEHGPAKIITMTNVFAHMSTLGHVMQGINDLLDDKGIFISESQYLLDLLESNQFDGIYHEHIRTYSLKSIVTLCKLYNLEVFKVIRASRYGGNIRVYICKKGAHKIQSSVNTLLLLENSKKLFEPETWQKFRERVMHNKNIFVEFMYYCKKYGLNVVADSCPGRGTVLMNYYNLDKSLIPYVSQLPGSEKIGKFVPGTQTPIVNNEIIVKDNPDIIVILAWHYADYIIANWKKKGLTSKFLMPLPNFKIIK